VKKFLQDCQVEIADSPEKADILFSEDNCWIAIWLPNSNNGDSRARLYIAPNATIFAWENRAGFIWGDWDELRSVVRGKKVFDVNAPISQQKPFDNDFLPFNGTVSRTETNRLKREGHYVPASV
jgi:hypothetical protein